MTSEKQKGPDKPLPSKHMAQGPDDFTRAAADAKDVRPDKKVEAGPSATAERKSGQKEKD